MITILALCGSSRGRAMDCSSIPVANVGARHHTSDLREMARRMYLLAAMKLDELRDEVASGRIDTVLLAITDMQGRLMGKRVAADHFVGEIAEPGAERGNFLVA